MRNKQNRNRKNKEEFTPVPSKRETLSRLLDIPQSVLAGEVQMEMAGNREVIVEGCQGVLEYDENVIRLAAKNMVVRFMGRGLQIQTLTHDSAFVTGYITSIEFLT